MASESIAKEPISPRVIDSHLHVWSEASQKPHPSAPLPSALGESIASIDSLVREMDKTGIDGALIVQPSNYRWNHQYVLSAVKRFPSRFRVMVLANPNLKSKEATTYIKRLASERGVVGVRFNPYLWPKDSTIDSPTGLAMFIEAGRLRLPVGIMAFKGLVPLLPQIEKLASASPQTRIIIDHFGFPRSDPAASPNGQLFDTDAWNALLTLGTKLPQVFVKVSALFRVSSTGGKTYSDLKSRFKELVAAYGTDRIMYGSDFPYVQLHEGNYAHSFQVVSQWAHELVPGGGEAKIMGLNAARLFRFPRRAA